LDSKSKPPVSTILKLTPLHSADIYFLSLVLPGILLTTRRSPGHILFIRADLPTFGAPTIATIGIFLSSFIFNLKILIKIFINFI